MLLITVHDLHDAHPRLVNADRITEISSHTECTNCSLICFGAGDLTPVRENLRELAVMIADAQRTSLAAVVARELARELHLLVDATAAGTPP